MLILLASQALLEKKQNDQLLFVFLLVLKHLIVQVLKLFFLQFLWVNLVWYKAL